MKWVNTVQEINSSKYTSLSIINRLDSRSKDGDTELRNVLTPTDSILQKAVAKFAITRILKSDTKMFDISLNKFYVKWIISL